MKTLTPMFFLATACGSVVPQSGMYEMTPLPFFENSCEYFEDVEVGTDPIEVEIIISNDGTDVAIFDMDCPFDGATFHCVSPETAMELSPPETTIFYLPEFEGTWTDSNEIEATQSFTFTCSGSGCDGFWPDSCLMEFDKSLVLLE